jgi:hypothetical protein
LVPHVLPLATLTSVSVHDGVPLEHASVPRWHALVGVQGDPAEHGLQAPSSHTSLVPHAVPLGAGLPVSVHTGRPVEQPVVPRWHVLFGVQVAPTVHAPHAPLSQTSLVPHVVPLAALFWVSVHTGAPVVQSVVPVWQALAGVHVAPCVHALHAPPLHTALVPHDVPLAALLPVSVHDGVPIEHARVPVWQALVGVHDAPVVHALHVPLSQTRLVPHGVPFATLACVSLHTGSPVEQPTAPTWQGLTGAHAAPAVHAPQLPSSQTAFVPHGLPLAALVCVSVHDGVPDEHTRAPVWHALVGVQAAPLVQTPHAPPLQTWLVPHEVPLDALTPVSLHTGTPVEQPMAPTWHAFIGMHDAPALHVLHAPLSHTSLVPQEVPLGALSPVSLHTGTPIEQSRVPA